MGSFSGPIGQPEKANLTSNNDALHNTVLFNAYADNHLQPDTPNPAPRPIIPTDVDDEKSHAPGKPTGAHPVRGKRRSATHWSVADIAWNRIDLEKARNDLTTYYVVTAASFIETAADLYTGNLVEHFPDPTTQQWLINYWQPEELQHGLALRTYVQTVWPELDWERGYDGFLGEYSQLCTMDELETSRALEMVARCVVEAGTSTFYTTLQNSTAEPVLKHLAGLIRQDEVSHYNHFRHYFQTYQKQERVGRIGVVRSLYKRFTEAENEDAYIGLKHAWLMRHPGETFNEKQFEPLNRELRALLKGHYPYRMALKMLLQPLALNRALVRLSLPLLEGVARRLMFKS